jgi:hypothetical protein
VDNVDSFDSHVVRPNLAISIDNITQKALNLYQKIAFMKDKACQRKGNS